MGIETKNIQLTPEQARRLAVLVNRLNSVALMVAPILALNDIEMEWINDILTTRANPPTT